MIVPGAPPTTRRDLLIRKAVMEHRIRMPVSAINSTNENREPSALLEPSDNEETL
jgi:hypothetical protein